MKKCFFFIGWLFASLLQAQDSTTTQFPTSQTIKAKPKSDINYFTMYMGSSNGGGHLQSVFFNNWGLDFSYDLRSPLSSNVPEGYKPFFVLWGDGKVRDRYRSVSLNVLRKFPVSNKTRFGTEIGFAYLKYETPVFNHISGLFGGYFIERYEVQDAFGSRLRTSFDWLITPYWGFEFGVQGWLNTIRPHLTADIKMTLGFLRRKIR
jgi:hypothetical protein